MKPFERSTRLNIDPQLATRLELLRDVPKRDPDRAVRGRLEFMNEAAKIPVPVSPEPKMRPNGWIDPIFHKERRNMISTLTSILVILSFVFGGAGITAYAAQESLPDQPLYSVKTLTEELRLGLTDSTQAELALQLEFLQRRFSELNRMLQDGKDLPLVFQARIQEQMQTNLQLASGLSDPDMQRFLLQYQEMLQTQSRAMDQLQNQMGTPQQDRLQTQLQDQIRQQIRDCEDGLQDPQLLRNRFMQSENGNAEPPAIIPEPGPSLTQPPYQNQQGQQSESPGKQLENGSGPKINPTNAPDSGNQPEEGNNPGNESKPDSGPSLEPGNGSNPSDEQAPQPGNGSGGTGGASGSPGNGGGGSGNGGGGK